jgi:tryptophan synthase beta chain
VGPEHALLHDAGRIRYDSVRDQDALTAFHLLGETEGILPALESAHAVAWLVREQKALAGATVVLNLSGRGDKDLGILEAADSDQPGRESRRGAAETKATAGEGR